MADTVLFCLLFFVVVVFVVVVLGGRRYVQTNTITIKHAGMIQRSVQCLDGGGKKSLGSGFQ